MIGTKFNYYDLSAITEVEQISVEEDTAPRVLSAGITAKGTEDLVEIGGTDFRTMFGAPNFQRYGQLSIQNQRVIAAGAKLIFKRIVAEDAALAHIILVAKLYQTSNQRVNAEGKPLYYDKDGHETTEESTDSVENEPIIDSICHVRYVQQATTNVKTMNEVVEAAAASLDTEGTEETIETEDGEIRAVVYSYPIICVTDNGRGVSNKRISISAEASLSKNYNFMYYTLSFIEDGDTTDSVRFSAIPDKVFNNECIDLNTAANTYLTQGKVQMIDDNMTAFISKLAELSGVDEDTLAANDVLFGATRKAVNYPTINVDQINGLKLDIATGIGLTSGSNGCFGDAPYKNADTTVMVNEQLLKFFNGDLTDEIYNLDVYQIDACFDANFPDSIKNAIHTLVNYRKDFMFFRDYGLNIRTIEDVREKQSKLPRSCWISDFCQAYDVIDPYSHKQVTVTITYSIAAMMIKHIVEKRHYPFAGERYNAVIDDIVDKGTLRFSPKILPSVNEKDEMEEMRVNFASFFQNKFIIESLFTAQEEYTQMSFSNNVMAVQQVIKALRVAFPAIRYQFVTKESDLERYEKEVNDVLSLYAVNFAELRYQYISDAKYRANKIFRAAIYFRFNEFFQGEMIDAYQLPTEVAA